MKGRTVEALGECYKVTYYRFWSKGRMYWRWQVIDGGGYPVVQGERRNNTHMDAELDVGELVAFLEALCRGDTDLQRAATISVEGSAYEVVHYTFWWKGLYLWRWRIKSGDDVVARGLRRTRSLADSQRDVRNVADFFESFFGRRTQQALAGEL